MFSTDDDISAGDSPPTKPMAMEGALRGFLVGVLTGKKTVFENARFLSGLRADTHMSALCPSVACNKLFLR
jgi:hypothetical protein